jgi:multidrug efflux pump subunit AcrB
MDIAAIAIKNRTTTLVLVFCTLVGGLLSYQSLSRLEDPEFTIKEALVITPYSGASAVEVAEEVSDEIEQAVQKLGQLDEVESKSDRGLSTVTVRIKTNYDRDALPQVWDELRRKVSDAQGNLPPGAGPSLVVDDYGDVYGVFVAVYGRDYSYAELKEHVDFLKKELLLVPDVAKIETYGERTEVIYVELQKDRLSQLGIPVSTIVNELKNKNVASYAGRVIVDKEYLSIEPSGTIASIEQIESILISSGDNQLFLRDIATVRRGYKEPNRTIMHFDSQQAIGLGISTVSGGNVVTMGEALEKRVRELTPQTPLGMKFGIVSLQSKAVTTAITGFVSSLGQAVAIVVVVLLLFMGLRSGILIGFILVLTIAGTFIFMAPAAIALERISLGALIIALGMLVDNAIVVVDGMLIRINNGEDPEKAGSSVVKQTAVPLLGATVVGVLAFAAIGTSDDSTGEFCRSLFQVVFISLMFSWVTGVTVTPLLGSMFLKKPEGDNVGADPYAGTFYTRYRGLLTTCIRRKWVSIAVVIALFASSLWGFRYVENSFFPSSTRPQFMVDVWLGQGSAIEETEQAAARIEKYLMGLEQTTHVTSLIGQGGLRFMLTYTPEKLNYSYLQFLVDVDDYHTIDALSKRIETELGERFPDTLSYVTKFQLGPGGNGKVQARFSGSDPNVLRSLSKQAQAIIYNDANAKSVRSSWRQRVKVVRPVLAEEQANLNGITRTGVAYALLQGFEGATVGLYREGDLLLPIILRAAQAERINFNSIRNLQIWSPVAKRYIPLRQVVSSFETGFEDEIIVRLDRKPTITVYCDPISGPASVLFERLRPQIEALDIPSGYQLEWGGEYEDSGEAQAALASNLPLFLLMMVLIVVILFNNLRQPLIIWLVVPLALIGVTAGLLSTNQPFGFMSLLGFLSLSGMLIKNAIVLIDEINLQEALGLEPLSAVINAGVSRLRPVAMAAATTALGLVPLLFDAFFIAMAVTIIFGLVFATVLTMVVIPVLYAIFYRLQIKS